DDATKLTTADGFKMVLVSRTRDGDDERLTIRLTNPQPSGAPAREDRPLVRLGITLPGPVRDANHDATVSGDHVAWVVSRRDYTRAAEPVLTVRWRDAAP